MKINSLFAGMYEADLKGARPSIAPKKLLRAMLLQVFFDIRSERQLMEQTQYNLLYRWFIGLTMDDAAWVPTVFTRNRERLIEHEAIIELFNHIVQAADRKGWVSGEHLSVDGTLIKAWASHHSFMRKDDSDDDAGSNATGSLTFKGNKRSNQRHVWRTDGDARPYRKGKTTNQLSYLGHTLSDNRHGLIADAMVSIADGHAQREAASVMIEAASKAREDDTISITLGADKSCCQRRVWR